MTGEKVPRDRKPIEINNSGSPSKHTIDPYIVGMGREHENVADKQRRGERMIIAIAAFAADANRPLLRLQPVLRDHSVIKANSTFAESVECVVDTGATVSLFKSEVAEQLGLHPDQGVPVDERLLSLGREIKLPRRMWTIYLEVGPHAIAVEVEFPVRRKQDTAGVHFEWAPGALKYNILGMKSVLRRCMLCFTPERLYAFETAGRPGETGESERHKTAG